MAERLHMKGVCTGTNVIIDYKDMEDLQVLPADVFDSIAWNPYWDGRWDREKAQERFKKYIK